MRIKKLPGALVITALVTLAISLGVATPNVYGDGDDSRPTLPEKPELKYPNLGSNLDQLVASVEKGKASAKEAAEDAPVHQEASVAVTIYLSGNLADVVSFLEDNGGSPRNVGEDYIEAYVPVTLLGQVSERPGVIRARGIAPPEPAQSAQQIAGHGPPVHGSTAWNQAGFGGQGVKVGVIDAEFGFNDFRGLMGTEFPSSVQARCYTDVGRFTSNLSNCGNALVGSNHGTLLAEAVMDIAPEASLYLATPWSLGDLQTATDWMVSQGVSVIVHGVTYNFDGPGDGTSPFSDSPLKTVDRAVAGGIVWVNAAGNYFQGTWFGTYSILTSGNSRFLVFDGKDVFNDLTLDSGGTATVQLRWEDSWQSASRDLDLTIWDHDAQDIVEDSSDPQQGRVGQVPYETLTCRYPCDGRYAVIVSHYSGSAPGWIQLIVGGDVGSIEYYTGNGSIPNPAESANPGMLAVGAAPWYDVNTIEYYSSRGPTPDGRVKPDIVGADCGATALRPLNEYGNGFCGTSQAAPHVAGMAALVRQRFPDYTPAQVAAYLKAHAEQRVTPDPNNTWGHGFAKLPTVDRAALMALYNATSGANWTNNTNWLTSGALSTWYGVTTDSQGRITELNLTRNQLKGEFPPELTNLTNLEVLALGGNQLTGTVPAWLGSLANLQELYLWSNELTGEIPTELGNLTNLERLYLSKNQLTGPIPSELGSLTNLQELHLTRNQLSGAIPPELGSLTNLEGVYLWGNELTGTIPAELGRLTSLQVLHLTRNQLSGAIPPELGSLTKLTRLRLENNQLSGVVPQTLAGLTMLDRFSFYNNPGLCAPVDDAFQTWLRGISIVYGSSCAQADSPEDRAVLVQLHSATDGANWTNNARWLSGDLTREWYGVTNDANGRVNGLFLRDNQLSGELLAGLGSLANLTILSLSVNRLTGTIPADLGSLSNLTGLYLQENQLTGPIPAELGRLTGLQELSLRDNQLSGAIPPELSRLTKLERLYLSQNMLTGCVPEAWRDIAESDVPELGLPFCTVSLNTAPVFSDSESNPITEAGRSVVENTAAGENVGTPVAAADNNGDTLTYALGGTDAASFGIDPLTGQLMTQEALDYETKGRYEVMVTATDPEGASDMITVTITVTNLDEAGTVTLSVGADALTMAPQVGDTITGAVMDPDGGVTGESWQWAKTMDDMDSRDMNSWMPITGATDAAYMVTAGDTGYYLRVMATYMDAAGTDMAMEYSMPTMMVDPMTGDTLLERYDVNNNGQIDLDEVFKAIDDYFDYDDRLTLAEIYELVDLYFES